MLPNVRFGSEADITRLLGNVRFTPQSGQDGQSACSSKNIGNGGKSPSH
jgi:hypothetical protein